MHVYTTNKQIYIFKGLTHLYDMPRERAVCPGPGWLDSGLGFALC